VLFSPGFHAMRPSVHFPVVPAVYDSQYIEFGSCTFCGCNAYEPCKYEMKEMEYYSVSDTTLLDFLLGRKCFDYNEICDVHRDQGGGMLKVGQRVQSAVSDSGSVLYAAGAARVHALPREGHFHDYSSRQSPQRQA
jgi:hypothetical protein